MAPEDTDPGPQRALATTPQSRPTPPNRTLSRAHADPPPCPARMDPREPLLLTGGRGPFARGRPPPRAARGLGGDNTQQRRGRFRSRGSGSRAQRAFSRPGEPGTRWGGRSAATRRGRPAGDGRQRVGSVSGERGAPTKARAGPPGKRARDPTATSTRAVPQRPATPAGLSTLGAPPLREPGPTPLGPNPTGPPPQGPRLNLQPVRLVRPGTTTRGEAPPGESGPTRAHTSPPAATRPGSGQRQTAARSAQGRRRAPARERPRARSQRTREPHAPDAGQARRDPPPTRRGEAQAAVGKRATLGPTAGPADPSQKRGLCPTRNGSHPASVATTRRGGAAAGGSGTPRHPLGSLEKAFSPRAHRPHPFVPPTEPRERASRRPPRAWGRGWVRGKGPAQGNPERSRPGPNKGATSASPHTPCSHHRPEGTSCPHRGHERSGDGHGMLGRKAAALGWPSATALARPGTVAHTPHQVLSTQHPQHDARQGTTRRPHPHRGGAGWASLTGSTTRSSDTPPDSGSSRGSLGTGNDAAARPQAPKATRSAPGAPQRARRHALSTPRR